VAYKIQVNTLLTITGFIKDTTKKHPRKRYVRQGLGKGMEVPCLLWALPS
jgi:hypothetical protein